MKSIINKQRYVCFISWLFYDDFLSLIVELFVHVVFVGLKVVAMWWLEVLDWIQFYLSIFPLAFR